MKSRAQKVRPTVQVGKDGITEAVIAELARQLKKHKLVKVRLLASSQARADKRALARELAEKTSSELVEIRGHTAVFYKE